MKRWRVPGVVALLLAGCRPATTPPPEPAPEMAPAPAPATLAELVDRLAAPEIEPAALGELLDALDERLPAAASRVLVARAVAELGDGSAAPSAAAAAELRSRLAEAWDELPGAGDYGVPEDLVGEALQAAGEALAAGRWTLVRLELQRAEVLLSCPVIAAGLLETRRAVAAGQATSAARTRLVADLRRLLARGAIGRAMARVEDLALAEAAAEVSAARRQIEAVAAADDGQRSGLLADLAGALTDVEAAAPGVDDRLRAIWKKLGRATGPGGG